MSDEEEELVDYSRLLKKGPKRGTTSLEASRQALFECLQTKPKLPKQCSQGVLLSRQPPFWTRITINKGTHLRTMGFSDKGTICLFPEEAAFLVSRDALIVKDEDDTLLAFQDFCMLLCDKETDGWITFDKYQVYAYLKRLGYIVTRSKTVIESEPVIERIQKRDHSLWDLFCNSLSSWIYKNRKLPLVWDYRYSSYRKKINFIYKEFFTLMLYTYIGQVYSTLQIIPSSPWYKPFYKSLTRSFDWDVYKPTSGWKKKNPGIPNFQIIVNE